MDLGWEGKKKEFDPQQERQWLCTKLNFTSREDGYMSIRLFIAIGRIIFQSD